MHESEAAAVEADIRHALHQGDFEAVVQHALDAHGESLTAFVRSRVPSVADADEVLAEVVAALWVALPRLQLHTSMRGYLFQMARHAANHHLARVVRGERMSVPGDSLDSGLVSPDGLRTATPQHLKTTNKDRIASLRASLSQEERTLLQLRVDQGLAFREVAQAMAEPDEDLDDEALARAAARWRKRYQLTKERLRTLAVESGLLDPS